MSLQAIITEQLTSAMREKATDRVAVLRLLKSSLKNEEIKLGHELSEDESMKVLQREAKQRRDSVEAYTKGDRPELAASEQAELEIIAELLPAQMTEEELEQMVMAAIAETGANTPADMGKVIGSVVKQSAGRTDGASVSAMVRKKLTSQYG